MEFEQIFYQRALEYSILSKWVSSPQGRPLRLPASTSENIIWSILVVASPLVRPILLCLIILFCLLQPLLSSRRPKAVVLSWNIIWILVGFPRIFKVAVVDNIVVVLWYVFIQIEMLRQEAQKKLWGPVIAKSFRANPFLLEHEIEYSSSVAAPLHTLVNVEIEDTEGVNFSDCGGLVPDEQVLLSHFQKWYSFVSFNFHIQSGIRTVQPRGCCDYRSQALSFRRGFTHFVNDLGLLVGLHEGRTPVPRSGGPLSSIQDDKAFGIWGHDLGHIEWKLHFKFTNRLRRTISNS